MRDFPYNTLFIPTDKLLLLNSFCIKLQISYGKMSFNSGFRIFFRTNKGRKKAWEYLHRMLLEEDRLKEADNLVESKTFDDPLWDLDQERL